MTNTPANPNRKTSAIWGGRFASKTNSFISEFGCSLGFDTRLATSDIEVSLAHVEMLGKQQIINQADTQAICQALKEIHAEIEAGSLKWKTDLEDVHMNIEARLVEKIGETGKKMHTARSRNDLVATDTRLFLKKSIVSLHAQICQLQELLLEKAKSYSNSPFPGFTHLQTAQPIVFGHHLMAWYHQLERDRKRLLEVYRETDVMPLGSAALAGTSYPIDRDYTSQLLGFSEVSENSLDAVSDRDFIISFQHCAAQLMLHFSRWCEEIILWMSSGYRLIELGDSVCTGSSIMPQKKNPDVAELIRGKSARVIGNFQAASLLMKSQPLAYNRDNQEDKIPLFESIDYLEDCLQAMAIMLGELSLNTARAREFSEADHALATEIADYLVRKGLSFREAHHLVGALVKYASEHQLQLQDIALEVYQSHSSLLQADIYEFLQLDKALEARNHKGGTAPAEVQRAIQQAFLELAEHKKIEFQLPCFFARDE